MQAIGCVSSLVFVYWFFVVHYSLLVIDWINYLFLKEI